MFEGRMDKTAWQRAEFEANNPKVRQIPQKGKSCGLPQFDCKYFVVQQILKCSISVEGLKERHV